MADFVSVPGGFMEVGEGIGGGTAQGGPRAAAPGRPAGPAGPAGAGSSKLDRKSNNRTSTQTQSLVILRPKRCGLRLCPDCAPRYGWKIRNALLDRAALFSHPALLSLTVDRRKFESPQDAFGIISSDGLIRRLLKRLKVKVWCWVLEFQEQTGTGWPHWHILINLDEVQGGRIDLDRAWHLWRDRWGIGGLQLEVRQQFPEPDHAINYATKYLTKYPAMGFPIWVLVHDTRIRFFGASKAVGALSHSPGYRSASSTTAPVASESSGQAPPAAPDGVNPHNGSCPKRHRPLYQRLAGCGMAANGILEQTYSDGSVRREYIGALPIRPDRVAYLARSGKLESGVIVESRHSDTGSSWLVTAVEGKNKLDARDNLARLEAVLRVQGELDRNDNDIAERMNRLLNQNKFAQRQDEPMATGPDGEVCDVPF